MTDAIPTSTTHVAPLARDRRGLALLTVGADDAFRAAAVEAFEARSTPIEVVAAATASEALARADEVNCLLTRQSLPESTGLALLRAVGDEHGELPVVLCPAEGSERLAAQAVNAGAEGYVPDDHPDRFERVADRVEAAVDERRDRERLAEAGQLLLRLTEYTTDVLWMFTDDWAETVVVNDAYDDVWDRSMADLVADPTEFLEPVHPEDRQTVRDAMERLSAGDAADIEYRIDFDGEWRWLGVHAEPVFDDDGEVEHVAGFTRDITELKDRELRMESLNEAATELLGARSHDEVATVTVDIIESVIGCPLSVVRRAAPEYDRLVALAASPGALERTGAGAAADLPPVTPGDPVFAAFDSGVSRLIEGEQALAAATDAAVEPLLAVPLGEHGALVVGTPPEESLSAFDRQLVELLGRTATAALDRVRRDDELEAYRERLERSNENLQQFAYTASHDLQEPLRMVASYVDLLESEYGDNLDEEAREYMDFAVDGARRMQDMIDALLQYARVQTRAAEFEETDPERVVEETLDALRMRLDEADATVTVGSLPAVEADPDQLGEVFQNLVENAVTYAAESGVDPEVAIDGHTDGDVVRFRVSDNGPGVDGTVGDVFEIFSRNGAHEADGTGIGLAVCRRIVRRHDGEISVESSSEGASFEFTIPASNPEVMTDD